MEDDETNQCMFVRGYTCSYEVCECVLVTVPLSHVNSSKKDVSNWVSPKDGGGGGDYYSGGGGD